MSQGEREDGVLTREELDAILTSLQDVRQAAERDAQGGGPFRPERASLRPSPLVRLLEDFAEDQARGLSTLYQRTIRFSLLSCETLTAGELAGSMLPSDRAIALALRPGAGPAWILLGRSFLFRWMTLAFGSRARTPQAIPDRPYTRIEERFLRRAAHELGRQFAKHLSLAEPPAVAPSAVLDPLLLAEDPALRVRVASFDVLGLDDVCRLRIALPDGVVDEVSVEPEKATAQAQAIPGGRMLELAVRVRVEAGSIELPLGRVAHLEVGDVLPLVPADGRGLVVRIEDEAKFRALRGSVGPRLAVQITDRL